VAYQPNASMQHQCARKQLDCVFRCNKSTTPTHRWKERILLISENNNMVPTIGTFNQIPTSNYLSLDVFNMKLKSE
jgi:hypothetical protein